MSFTAKLNLVRSSWQADMSLVKSNTMLLPNFIIIGTQKAGTGSVYTYLSQHPEIAMSATKEPMFFCYSDGKLDLPFPADMGSEINDDLAERYGVSVIKSWDHYCALFRNSGSRKIRGEASTWYLYSPGSARRISQRLPGDTKCIAMLRNPAERAYSAYMYFLRRGIQLPSSFEDAVRQSKTRTHPHWLKLWHMVQRGFYSEQVRRYQELFGERLRVYLFEEFVADPIRVIRDICSFLEVDSNFVPDTSGIYGKSGLPEGTGRRIVYDAMQLLRDVARPFKAYVPPVINRRVTRFENALLSKAPLETDLKLGLLRIYQEDILKLQHLMKRDLSEWTTDLTPRGNG
jgi:hypothetical protein